MVNHLEFCRDKLYFCADEFFPYYHHRTPAVIAYLFPFIYGMEYFAVREIFYQFFPRTGEEAKQISDQQLRWLLEGLNPEQPKAVQKWLPHKSENTENP